MFDELESWYDDVGLTSNLKSFEGLDNVLLMILVTKHLVFYLKMF